MQSQLRRGLRHLQQNHNDRLLRIICIVHILDRLGIHPCRQGPLLQLLDPERRQLCPQRVLVWVCCDLRRKNPLGCRNQNRDDLCLWIVRIIDLAHQDVVYPTLQCSLLEL